MIIILLTFLIISFLFFLFFFIFALDNLIFSHDLPTSKKAILNIVKVIREYKPNALNFYDLGCGRGSVVLELKKQIPNLNVYGIDKNRFRIFVSKLKAFFLKRKINFIRQNIFNLNLSDADIVYTYLWYDLMPILEKKLQKELKKGAIVITNTSHFQNWVPKKIINTWDNIKDPKFEKLFIYEKDY